MSVDSESQSLAIVDSLETQSSTTLRPNVRPTVTMNSDDRDFNIPFRINDWDLKNEFGTNRAPKKRNRDKESSIYGEGSCKTDQLFNRIIFNYKVSSPPVMTVMMTTGNTILSPKKLNSSPVPKDRLKKIRI